MVVDDISAFLPPGFKLPAKEDEDESKPAQSTTEKAAEETTEKKEDFKLGLSSLFSNIKTDDVASFLPPGFNPEAKPPVGPPKPEEQEVKATSVEAPEPAATTAKPGKITLKFPTRPGSTGDKPKPKGLPKSAAAAPPPVVPKIKSFADR